MSSNETISTQQQQVEVKQEMDDESDSCFATRKPVAQLFKRSSDQSDNCAHVKSSYVADLQVPLVIKTHTSKTSSIIPNVKSVHSTNSCNIDTIANNLKSKQTTIKQKETQSIPKVSLVSKVNQIQSKPSNRTIYNDESLNKAYAHKLILHQLRKQQENNELKKLEDEDLDDDLTDLSWLTTFNLSNLINTPNSLTLSPPKSPSSAPSSPSSNSLLNSTLDDEADCNTLHIKRDTKFSNQLLASILALNSLDDSHKPPFTFSCLIFLAIESCERKRLSVKEIYAWISQTFVYYHNVPSGSWKNSIRHNLALNKSFSKVDKNLLAMRDFSGKGSLWCIDSKVRTLLLDLFQKCSLAHNLEELNKSVLLADVNETSLKQHHQQTRQNIETSINKSNKLKIKPMKTSNINPTKPILNPQLVGKLQNVPKLTHVLPKAKSFSKSNSFNHAKPSVVISTSPSPAEVCSELDAVKALLSMKSKATSMPSILTSEENSHAASKNRRKQMLKQPTKKCDDDDDEDDEVDVEDDYFIDEDEDDEFDESYSTQENDKSLNVNDVTDDEEENEEDCDEENGKLKIDEGGESETNSKKDANNLLLELSRAAVLVETEKDDEPSKKKLKINKS